MPPTGHAFIPTADIFIRREVIAVLQVKSRGDFSKTIRFLGEMKTERYLPNLDEYGKEGVAALKNATPKDTGVTADSWYYTIEKDKAGVTIRFSNSNIQNGIPIAIILQYGHGTGSGGYVAGRDYINPAIQPIFDKLAQKAWKKVMEA